MVLPPALSAQGRAGPRAPQGRAAREVQVRGVGAQGGQGVPAGADRPSPAWVLWAGQELALCHRGRPLLLPLHWAMRGFGHGAVRLELLGLVWLCVC